MKIIRIVVFSYAIGILVMNALAFVVWARNPAVSGMDFPTVLLAVTFSFIWPVGLFGDFMASPSVLRKLIDVSILVGVFALGLAAEAFISNKILKKKNKGSA